MTTNPSLLSPPCKKGLIPDADEAVPHYGLMSPVKALLGSMAHRIAKASLRRLVALDAIAPVGTVLCTDSSSANTLIATATLVSKNDAKKHPDLDGQVMLMEGSLRTGQRMLHVFWFDGPLTFDDAIFLRGAKVKHIETPVAGDADILAERLERLGGAIGAGLMLRARTHRVNQPCQAW